MKIYFRSKLSGGQKSYYLQKSKAGTGISAKVVVLIINEWERNDVEAEGSQPERKLPQKPCSKT